LKAIIFARLNQKTLQKRWQKLLTLTNEQREGRGLWS